MINPYKSGSSSLEDFVNSIYPNLQSNFSDMICITNRAILNLKNNFVMRSKNPSKTFPWKSYKYHNFGNTIGELQS